MSDQMEWRSVESQIELRAKPGGGMRIGGYATVFAPEESKNLGGFVERSLPSVFDEVRFAGWVNDDGSDVICRYNHESNMLLGRTSAGTLQLGVDSRGLEYNVDLPKSREDIREGVERGDIRHSSFAFRVKPGGDEWSVDERNIPLRTLTNVELIDVAPVLSPGYGGTSVAMRSLGEWQARGGIDLRDQMSTADTNDLPDSAFAYIEPGGTKDSSGKTKPRSLRHFPIHDPAHVRNALARAPQSPFGAKALPKIKAAARKFGIGVADSGSRSMTHNQRYLASLPWAAQQRRAEHLSRLRELIEADQRMEHMGL